MISILQELQISSIDKLKNEEFIKEKLDGRNPQLISKMLLMIYSMDREIKQLTARIDRYEHSGSVSGVELLSNEINVDNNSSHTNVNDDNGTSHGSDNGTDHGNNTDTDDDYDTDNDNDTDNYSDNDTDDYIDNGTDTGTDNSNDIGDGNDDIGKDIVNDINDRGKDVVNDISDIGKDTDNDSSKDINSDVNNDIDNDIGNDVVNDTNNDIGNDISNDIGNNTNNDIGNNTNNGIGNSINNSIGNENGNSTNTKKLNFSNSKNTYIFNDDENKIVKRLSWPEGPHVFKIPISFNENFCSTMNENFKKSGKPWPEISLNQLAIKFKIPKDILARPSRNLNAGFKNYNKLKANHYNGNNSKSGVLKQSKQIENKRNIKRKELVVPKTENKNVNEVKNNKNPIKKRPKKLRITRSRIQRNRNATDDVESSSESVSDPNAPSSSEDEDDKDDDAGKQSPFIKDNKELNSNESNSKTSELSTNQPARTPRNSAKRSVEDDDEEKSTKLIKKPKNCKIKQENKTVDFPIKEETKSSDFKTHNHLSMAELLNHTTLKLENSDISNDPVLSNKNIDDHHKIRPAYISQTHIVSDQSKKPVSLSNQPEFKYTVTEKGFFKCDTCLADPQIFLQYIDLYRHKQLQHPEEFPKYVIQ